MCLGLAQGYIESKEKKVSLLKPYTNNDRINDMSIEEKAEFLYDLQNGGVIDGCGYCEYYRPVFPHCLSYKETDCVEAIKKYLESEAE